MRRSEEISRKSKKGKKKNEKNQMFERKILKKEKMEVEKTSEKKKMKEI